MADYSITITNRINLFGPAPSNKWNAYNWGSFNWGEGNTDLPVHVVKVISNSLAPTDSVTPSVYFYKEITNTLTPTSDMESETLTDGSGYTYVFPSNATDGEDRDIPTWTEGSSSSLSFTCQAAGSTTWS